MFQSFEEKSDPSHGNARAGAMRDRLAAEKLRGFLIPRADVHQGEYVPACAERLAWISGFTGSAGIAAVLDDQASIFVDGRYTAQVQTQVDTDVFTPRHLIESPVADWLAETVQPGDRIGYDPWLHTIDGVEKLREKLEAADAQPVPVSRNLVDEIWTDRPPAPAGLISVQPLDYAGQTVEDKITEIRKAITEKKADATVLTLPDSIAWLFNIRGSDIPHNPVPLSFAIVPASGTPTLFVDAAKITDPVAGHLARVANVIQPSAFVGAVQALGDSKSKVLLDRKSAPQAVAATVESGGGTVLRGADPCILPKAVKNDAELRGARSAHIRDGAAMANFLSWIDQNALSNSLDEISAASRLEECRRSAGEQDGMPLLDIAFDSISGAGANGAIVHYRVTEKTNRTLERGSLYLIDSGGQYRDGTTDITRTVAIGEPSDDMRRRFTQVLKGHIAIATARFPVGTTGSQIDTLARIPLWKAGCDFDHGTGHGVGSYLNVHEGPQGISRINRAKLEPGMILSNEPGYYKNGSYGIRIENLVIVTEAQEIGGGDRPMLGFETITLAPIDRRLIDRTLLSDPEAEWLNAYHARVRDALMPKIKDKSVQDWLIGATEPV